MKKRNWLSLVALAMILSIGLSSCYYGSYGPPRGPGYGRGGHHHGGHHGGHGHGGYHR